MAPFREGYHQFGSILAAALRISTAAHGFRVLIRPLTPSAAISKPRSIPAIVDAWKTRNKKEVGWHYWLRSWSLVGLALPRTPLLDGGGLGRVRDM